MKRIGLKWVSGVGSIAACLLAGLAYAEDDAPAKQPQGEQLYIRLLGTSA